MKMQLFQMLSFNSHKVTKYNKDTNLFTTAKVHENTINIFLRNIEQCLENNLIELTMESFSFVSLVYFVGIINS